MRFEKIHFLDINAKRWNSLHSSIIVLQTVCDVLRTNRDLRLVEFKINGQITQQRALNNAGQKYNCGVRPKALANYS